MIITRIYATDDGESHFAEVQLSLSDAGSIGRLSEAIGAQAIIFRETALDYDYDWHPAPQCQYIVLLDGHIEIEVSNGEKRLFRGGDVLLVEDTHGKGHRTRTTDGKLRRSIFITLPEREPVANLQSDVVQEASEESFPASDAPSWTGTAMT